VRCHYFVLPQRAEDRVLEVLVAKTERIRRELGSLAKVIEDDIERKLVSSGIEHSRAEQMAQEIEASGKGSEKLTTVTKELEIEAQKRKEAIREEIQRSQNVLQASRKHIGFREESFRQAISSALVMMDSEPLRPLTTDPGERRWLFPALDKKAETDPSWNSTLDTLREPKRDGLKVTQWRRDAPIRPVVFEDAGVLTDETVHLHLEQRVANRLLARFRAQGFVHHDLSRACLSQVKDSTPRVLLLARLSLYGSQAERLHEEVIVVASRWTDPRDRKEPLKAYAREALARTQELLVEAMEQPRGKAVPNVVQERLLAASQQDIAELRHQIEVVADAAAAEAEAKLSDRAERKASRVNTNGSPES
jgi:hypothetical protein